MRSHLSLPPPASIGCPILTTHRRREQVFHLDALFIKVRQFGLNVGRVDPTHADARSTRVRGTRNRDFADMDTRAERGTPSEASRSEKPNLRARWRAIPTCRSSRQTTILVQKLDVDSESGWNDVSGRCVILPPPRARGTRTRQAGHPGQCSGDPQKAGGSR